MRKITIAEALEQIILDIRNKSLIVSEYDSAATLNDIADAENALFEHKKARKRE